jgi:hypothetical protein
VYRALSKLPYLSICALTAVTLASCGGDSQDSSGEAVATVGDTSIPKAEVEHRITEWKKHLPPNLQASPAKQRRLMEKSMALMLINAEWIEQEAKAEDVDVSDAATLRWYADIQKKQRKEPDPTNLVTLAVAKGSETAPRSEGRVALLRQELIEKATERQLADPTSLRTYYDAHKSRFFQPENRGFQLVLTKSKSDIEKAKREIESGAPWPDVSDRYSAAPFVRSEAGITTVLEGELSGPFAKALYRAPRGVIQGPLAADGGWYLFKVVRVTPARQVPFHEATGEVGVALRQEIASDLADRLQKKYQPKTTCADGIQVPYCKDSPADAAQQ